MLLRLHCLTVVPMVKGEHLSLSWARNMHRTTCVAFFKGTSLIFICCNFLTIWTRYMFTLLVNELSQSFFKHCLFLFCCWFVLMFISGLHQRRAFFCLLFCFYLFFFVYLADIGHARFLKFYFALFSLVCCIHNCAGFTAFLFSVCVCVCVGVRACVCVCDNLKFLGESECFVPVL